MGFLSDVGDFFADMGDDVGGSVAGLFDDLFRSGAPDEMAGQLMRLAQQVDQLGAQLAGDAAEMNWQGYAADSFRQHTAHLSEQFRAISTELRDAADLAANLT